MTWVDRAGKALGAIGQPGLYRNPELSPDGARVAVNALDAQGGTQDLWLVELARGVTSRFTFDPGNDIYPVWSPDGSRIVFGSDRDGGVPHLYQKRADGVGIEEPFVKSSQNMLPHSWSPDGRFLAYRTPVNGRSQIGILPLVGEQTLRLFDPSRFLQFYSQVSPDGRWLAYNADESGRFEVYVQSFPAPGGGKWQISKDGGWFPRWRRDGRELFYYASDERLMAVPVRSATRLDVGAAVPLFEAHLLNGPANAAGLQAPVRRGARRPAVPAQRAARRRGRLIDHRRPELDGRSQEVGAILAPLGAAAWGDHPYPSVPMNRRRICRTWFLVNVCGRLWRGFQFARIKPSPA